MASPIAQRQDAERLAARLPPLLVAAQRIAATVAPGLHGRRRVGLGESFWQFRDYAAGDPPLAIDWRQSAKADRVFVREMEWEAAQTVWLWVDPSASMDWASARDLPEKRERAGTLALALAILLTAAGERVALLGAGQAPLSGRLAVERLTLALERQEPDAALPSLDRVAAGSQAVLLGDWMGPLEDLRRLAAGLAERRVGGALVQVLDPAEISFPFQGRVRLGGLEGEGLWEIDRAESVRADYGRRLSAQQTALSDLARRLGWGLLHHETHHAPTQALTLLYRLLAERADRPLHGTPG